MEKDVPVKLNWLGSRPRKGDCLDLAVRQAENVSVLYRHYSMQELEKGIQGWQTFRL